MTVLIYALLCALYGPPNLTLPENIFLVVDASIFSFTYCFLIGSHRWIDNRLPGWLNLFWGRLVLYLPAVLALQGILYACHLPKFYDTVIASNISVILVPCLLVPWRQVVTSPANEALIASRLSQTDDELIFRPKPFQAIFLLVGGMAFVLGGIFLISKSPTLAWICIGFFGLATIVGFFQLLPGCCQLTLNRAGFVMVILWRRISFHWMEVTDFAVVSSSQGPRVGWNFSDPASKKASRLLTEMYGRNSLLLNDYGVAPAELCRIMNEWKRDHGSIR
jgi:hypothetical protein